MNNFVKLTLGLISLVLSTSLHAQVANKADSSRLAAAMDCSKQAGLKMNEEPAQAQKDKFRSCMSSKGFTLPPPNPKFEAALKECRPKMDGKGGMQACLAAKGFSGVGAPAAAKAPSKVKR